MVEQAPADGACREQATRAGNAGGNAKATLGEQAPEGLVIGDCGGEEEAGLRQREEGWKIEVEQDVTQQLGWKVRKGKSDCAHRGLGDGLEVGEGEEKEEGVIPVHVGECRGTRE